MHAQDLVLPHSLARFPNLATLQSLNLIVGFTIKRLVEGRRVVIKSVATDVYGRGVAHVWQYSDGLYINQIRVDSGHADWV